MSISEQKIKSLIDDGHEEIGELMDENNRMILRIADLEEALKIAVVKLQGEQDPIGWPIDRFIDVVEGRPFR